jgi:hypothetical protein
MGMRSGTTFKKRQKEIARMEKQRDKAARRVQRKVEKENGEPAGEDDDLLMLDEDGNPMEPSESVRPQREVAIASADPAPVGAPTPVHE